jgi:hypothetical protein
MSKMTQLEVPMSKSVLLLTSMLLVAVPPASIAQDIAQTYEKALYAAGIGTRPDSDGTSQRPTFSLLDEVTTAGNVRAALMSERIPYSSSADSFADALFTIRFGTFLGPPGSLRVAHVVDVTSLLTNYTDEPGNFRVAGGSVNAFRIDATRSGLHVHAYSVLSGNGAVTEAIDLFFELRDAGTLRQVLLLPRTTTRWRASAGTLTVEDSTIVVVDTNGDGVQEIVVQRRRDGTVDEKPMAPVIFPAQAYAFDGGAYRPSAAPVLALANVKPLERAATAAVKIVTR